jgi:hypothetical protein
MLYLAQVEICLDQPERAVDLLRPLVDAMDDVPQYIPDVHRVLGQAYAHLGRGQEAAYELANASQDLGLWPKDRRMAQSWATVATSMENVQEYDDAIMAYQQALACAGF